MIHILNDTHNKERVPAILSGTLFCDTLSTIIFYPDLFLSQFFPIGLNHMTEPVK